MEIAFLFFVDSVKALIELIAHFQVVINTRLKKRRITAILEYFRKKGIIFDGVYKDTKANKTYYKDYSQIFLDFEIKSQKQALAKVLVRIFNFLILKIVSSLSLSNVELRGRNGEELLYESTIKNPEQSFFW